LIAFEKYWGFTEAPLELSRDDVHIWRLELEQLNPCARKLVSVLSMKEREKAASFCFENHRKNYILGHGGLRIILGSYLNTEPGQLEFRYGSYGKPYVAQRCLQDRVEFNLTHSDGLALCAFTRGRRVGIDLEHIQITPEVVREAENSISTRRKWICHLMPPYWKGRAFFKSWTRREAYLKALGTGLNYSFAELQASRVPKEPPHWMSGKRFTRVCAWSAMSFVPYHNYTATLVAEGNGWHPHFLEFVSTPSEWWGIDC